MGRSRFADRASHTLDLMADLSSSWATSLQLLVSPMMRQSPFTVQKVFKGNTFKYLGKDSGNSLFRQLQIISSSKLNV